MGSISRMDRCDQFIREFNSTAIKKLGINEEYVDSQGLGFSEGEEVVRFFIDLTVTDGTEQVMQPLILFVPDELNEDAIERTAECFGLSEDETRQRFIKAGIE